MTKASVNVDRFRKKLKRKMVEAFGGRCACCSYDTCIHALEFHHVDPKMKDFSFGAKWSKSWKKISSELKKCVMLCSNCHKEVHANITQVPSTALTFDESRIVTETPPRKLKIDWSSINWEKYDDLLETDRFSLLANDYGVSISSVRKWAMRLGHKI